MITTSETLKTGKIMIYNFADIRWDIRPKNGFVCDMLAPFKSEGELADVIIKPFDGDADAELKNLLYEVNLQLLGFDGLMLHSAAIAYKNKAYLFAAPSGTGKTTHIMLWKKYLRERVTVICGDKPFLRLTDSGVTVYGGPWQGKERLGTGCAYPLGGIFFLNRAEQNDAVPATTAQKLCGCMNSVLFELGGEQRLRTVEILSEVCKRVPAFMLYCNMENDAVQTVLSHIDEGAVI